MPHNSSALVRRAVVVLAVGAASMAGGCRSGCYLIAPATGITLTFVPSNVAGPLHVEVTTFQLGAFVYDCTDTTRCASSISIPDYYPSSATVRITYQGRTKSVPITPRYVEEEVNGSGCGTSRRAMVEIVLP